MLLQGLFGEAREPVNDLMQLGLGAAFLFDLGEVVGVDGGEGQLGDAGVVIFGGHGVPLTLSRNMPKPLSENVTGAMLVLSLKID